MGSWGSCDGFDDCEERVEGEEDTGGGAIVVSRLYSLVLA